MAQGMKSRDQVRRRRWERQRDAPACKRELDVTGDRAEPRSQWRRQVCDAP